MTEIKIDITKDSVTVSHTNWRGIVTEIAYVDKNTSMEDIGQEFYELCAVLNAKVEMRKL